MDAAAEDEENAGQTRVIGDARPSALWPAGWSGKERFDEIPQRIEKQYGAHTRSRYFANEDYVSEFLLRALSGRSLQQSDANQTSVEVCVSVSSTLKHQRCRNLCFGKFVSLHPI